jgi:acyl carrier protein
MDVEGGVIEVLQNVSRRPIDPTPTSDLIADLGFDSLQVMELVTELEDRFDIVIPAGTAPTVRTVAEVVAQVSALVDMRPSV